MAHTKARSIWDPQIVRTAVWDSFRKLHPRTMMKNPVMFVVEVGSVLTTARLLIDAAKGRPDLGFELQITFWLWLTVLFANFAEAMAEGRGKAQADTLRKARTDTVAHRLTPPARPTRCPPQPFAKVTWCRAWPAPAAPRRPTCGRSSKRTSRDASTDSSASRE
jgi:high-affinity K+ transport system ATPase subunit B